MSEGAAEDEAARSESFEHCCDDGGTRHETRLLKALDRVGVLFLVAGGDETQKLAIYWPVTFPKKWPVGARRCPMSAKAEANAAAALRELGATG